MIEYGIMSLLLGSSSFETRQERGGRGGDSRHHKGPLMRLDEERYSLNVIHS